MSDTPIWDGLVRELYAERTREAYAASPGMVGCGQWELPPDRPGRIPGSQKRRRRR